MLLSHKKFSSFTKKPLADTKTNIAGLFSLSVGSIDEITLEKVKEALKLSFNIRCDFDDFFSDW